MSEGLQISVVNLASYPVSISITLHDAKNWESKSSPLQLSGEPIAGNSSREVHCEIQNGQSSARFDVGFEIAGVGSVVATADALPVVNGGKRQGYLGPGAGNAMDKYWVMEAQYDKQPWDKYSYNWRHLAVIIMPKVDTRNWMARLPEDTQLLSLTIPATHDTGTAAITGREDNSIARSRICQGLSIRQQLEIGVRFLDIRVNKSRNFEIMHEDTPTALWFAKDCLVPVMEFLEQHDKETILLCVKDEHGSTDGFHDDILKMLAEAPYQQTVSRVCTSQVPPLLKDARGKVVLLRRYWIDPKTNKNKVDDPNSGFGLTDFEDPNGKAYSWPPNSDTFDQLGKQEPSIQQPGKAYVAIQDWYDLQTRFQASKVATIQKYLDAAKTSLSGTYFINFTSTTASGHSWDDPRNFAVGEDGIHAALITYMVTRGRGRYGILPLDYAGNPPEDILIPLLINNNPLV